MWLSGFRTQNSVCEDGGSVPGLTEWVKDQALLQAAHRYTFAMAVAWAAGPALETSKCQRCNNLKKKKKKKADAQLNPEGKIVCGEVGVGRLHKIG